MTVRKYSSRSQQTTLASSLTASATTMTVVSGSALMASITPANGETFSVVINPDTAIEEIVDVTAVNSNTLTIVRGIEKNGVGEAHSAGSVVRHMITGRDLREANTHIEASAGVHGLTGTVVGTTDSQTLTNKTLTAPTITNPSITGAGVDASIVFEGATADAHETTLTVVDPTQDNTITLPNTTGTVVLDSATQTLTNKTLTSPTISGSPTITGLSSAGMVASSATPKDYVDAILGSSVAASTSAASAATSATSAATSASSASTSASNALTSANSASTSATAAATSATSAAASATAAATSATSAAASATAASTSETNAATSASSAATSASSALTSANSASTSATNAANSATASATSASAAATSATSAAASATAAATSATSAAASATAAATSATSAAASATTAANSATAAATSATSAAASATAAATSETNAAASATAAATSASSAATSASSALTSANSASTSASSALTSANSAATSATSAAASYDQFDDRYLGDKSSDPTVDNDGNPLLTGALYFNTVVGAMKVYDGAQWDLVAPDTSNFIDKSILAGKGSLISASDASTPVNLTAPSTNGYILTYDSATTSGLAWAAPNPGDITAVTAGDGLTGGGTSGDVTLAVDSTVLRTTGGQVISANTSANALEIRQTGTGNALVIEDETNPDASPIIVTPSGSLLVGTTTIGADYKFKVLGRATIGPDADVSPDASGNGYIQFDGSGYSGFITLDATGMWVGHNTASRALLFATDETERMRIDGSGNVNIGAATPAAGGTNTGGLSIAGQDIQLMTIMGAWI